MTEYAAKHESRFVKLLIQQNEIGGKRKTAAATKQLEQAQERISEVSRIIKRLYEDNVNGKISDERFMELSADYEQEQRELKDRAAALQAELDKSQAATVNAEKFMGIVRKHLAFEELTPTLLREMIEKIVVHECSYDENGTRRQDIEIYYSFVGKIDLPELNARPIRHNAQVPDRNGKIFYTSITSLSHISKKSGYEAGGGEGLQDKKQVFLGKPRAVLIVTNTWTIVMGVFEAAQSVVAGAAGVVVSDATVDISSITEGLEERLMEMDIGPL